jgi:two-component system LytT family response regulator
MEIYSTVEQTQLSDLADHNPARAADNIAQHEEWDEFIPANDFVLLVDKERCWLIRVSDISAFEARGNYTRVHLGCAAPLIRRLLQECERRLNPSLFFRANNDWIINISRVRQTRFRTPFEIVFVLWDGREVVASHERSLVFRRSRAL